MGDEGGSLELSMLDCFLASSVEKWHFLVHDTFKDAIAAITAGPRGVWSNSAR